MKCPVLEAWEKVGFKKFRPCGGRCPSRRDTQQSGEILLGLLVLCLNYELCLLNEVPGFSS